jgi:hypothetical protein
LRRAAIVGFAFMVEVAASCWLPMVGADDRGVDPQAAAELAVRKRILANWQARQEHIKSFYLAWKTGPDDQFPKWARAGLAGVRQLWVASDGRYREEFPKFTFGWPEIFGRQEQACDGKSLRTLWTPLKIARSNGTLENPSANWFPSGTVQAVKDRSERKQNVREGAELLAFRPLQSLFGDWTFENSHVTSQNAIVGHGHYVKIEKDKKSGITEACWVDPRRDDLVVHYQRQYGTRSQEWTSLEYKQDPRHGWVPTGWQSESRDINEQGMRKSTDEAVVTECKINADFSLGTFQIKFPAGAIVNDIDSQRDYFVRRDDSHRTIERDESGAMTYEQLVNEDTTRPAKP